MIENEKEQCAVRITYLLSELETIKQQKQDEMWNRVPKEDELMKELKVRRLEDKEIAMRKEIAEENEINYSLMKLQECDDQWEG